jgi:hypothetical protein
VAHYGDVSLFLFSDHGMTDIKEVCDVMGHIDKLGRSLVKIMPRPTTARWDASGFSNRAFAVKIEAALREEPWATL